MVKSILIKDVDVILMLQKALVKSLLRNKYEL